MSCKTVLFGYLNAKPLVNLLILLIKQYIISCKAKENRSNLSMEGLQCQIMQYFKMEKHISKCSLTAETFHAKWEGVLGGTVVWP